MIKIVAGCVGVLVAGLALAADTLPLLTQLRADLERARALPIGEKTSYHCPAGLDQLKGVRLTTIMAALPKPDYENSNSVSYFLASPVPHGQRGGGFPEVTFISSASGTVTQITCFLAK